MSDSTRDIEPLIWHRPDCPDNQPNVQKIGGTTKSSDEVETAAREALQNAVDHPALKSDLRCKVDICYIKAGDSIQERKLVRLFNHAVFKNKDLARTDKEATGYLLIRDYGSGIEKNWPSIQRFYLSIDVERETEEKQDKLGGRGIGRTAFIHLSSRSAYAMISWPKSNGGTQPFILGHAANAARQKKKAAVMYAAREEILPKMRGEKTQTDWISNNIHCARSLIDNVRDVINNSLVRMFDDQSGCMVVIPIAGTHRVVERVEKLCIENFGVRMIRHGLAVNIHRGVNVTTGSSTSISKEEVKNSELLKFIPSEPVGNHSVCRYYLKDKEFVFPDGLKEQLEKDKSSAEAFTFTILVVEKQLEGEEEVILGPIEVFYADVDVDSEPRYIVWRRGMSIIKRRVSNRDVALVIEQSRISDIVGSLETSKHDSLSVKNLDESQAEDLYEFLNGVPGLSIDSHEGVEELMQPLVRLIENLPRFLGKELDPPEVRGAYFEGTIPGSIGGATDDGTGGGGGGGHAGGGTGGRGSGGFGGKGGGVKSPKVEEFTYSLIDGVVVASVKEGTEFAKGDLFSARFAIEACRGMADKQQDIEDLRRIEVSSDVDWLERLDRKDTTDGTEVRFRCKTDDFANGESSSVVVVTVGRFNEVTPDIEMEIHRKSDSKSA